jgi:hypothetical protein
MIAESTRAAERLRLDAAEVLEQARASAYGDLEPSACLLVDTLRLCFPTEADALAALGEACSFVDKDAEADEAAGLAVERWPLPLAELHRRLVAYVGDALKVDRRLRRDRQPLAWNCFRALRDGAAWLATAAKLEPRDGHVMRRPGGLRLAPSAFGGERLRAQMLPVAPSPGVPSGDVLRISWEDNGRRVVQSKPGRFGEADCTAEPE